MARISQVVVAALLMAVVPGAVLAFEGQADDSLIVVRGTGSVPVAPDRAQILFSIESRAASPADVANETARIQVATVDALHGAGLLEGAVSSVGYSVEPEWEMDENRNRELRGYVARSSVRLETRTLDRVGEFIDVALSAGITGVRSVVFEASDVDMARREALAAATEQARLDAEAIARAAGGRLGGLVEITLEEPAPEAGVAIKRYRPPTTNLVPGQQSVTATILARWRFEE